MELLLERSGGEVYAASDVGTQYILYFTNGGSAGLDLKGHASEGDVAEFTLKWVDVNTDEWRRETTVARANIVKIAAPSQGGWLAAIVRKP